MLLPGKGGVWKKAFNEGSEPSTASFMDETGYQMLSKYSGKMYQKGRFMSSSQLLRTEMELKHVQGLILSAALPLVSFVAADAHTHICQDCRSHIA